MSKRVKAKAYGYWRYIGDGTRIPNVPRRDLTPDESLRYGEWIEQVNAAGQALYAWTELDEPVVLATAPAPEWTVDVTGQTATFAKPGATLTVDSQIERMIGEAGSDE